MARKSALQKIGEIQFGVTFKAEQEFRNRLGQYITRIEKERRGCPHLQARYSLQS